MFKIGKYELRPELYYHPEEHLWLDVHGRRARVGMDPLQQETKGAFVVIQLQVVGSVLHCGDSFGSAEAEKHVGPLRAPVSGKIAAHNPAVLKNPRLANSDPYGEGWLIEMEMSSFEEEKSGLITGEADLRRWYEAEIRKYEEWGWLAE